jgi:membrane protein
MSLHLGASRAAASPGVKDIAMHIKKLLDLAKKSVVAWVDDYAPSMGAAISYYTVFSLAPLLIIVIAVAGLVFGRDAVQGQIVTQLSGLIGQDGAEVVQGLIKSADQPIEGLVAGSLSIVLLLVGATTVFGELQSALDRIWHVPEKDKPSGIWAQVRSRFLSFGLILGLAFLMMVTLTISAGVAAVGSWAGSLLPAWEILLQGLNIGISLAVSTVLFAMIYKLMPTARIAWHDVWIGAAVTAALFELGKVLIGLYVGKAGVSSSYAAAGAIAVLLVWVYYAAQIFLLGAEFTKVFAMEHGSIAGRALPEDPVKAQAESGTPGATTAGDAQADEAQADEAPPPVAIAPPPRGPADRSRPLTAKELRRKQPSLVGSVSLLAGMLLVQRIASRSRRARSPD